MPSILAAKDRKTMRPTYDPHTHEYESHVGKLCLLLDKRCKGMVVRAEKVTQLGMKMFQVGIVPFDEYRLATEEEIDKWEKEKSRILPQPGQVWHLPTHPQIAILILKNTGKQGQRITAHTIPRTKEWTDTLVEPRKMTCYYMFVNDFCRL